ncbi:AGAP001011-PA-like protein [Anopheles sinensis]|uniref:AGAP001011-PA-like protein n=1 Tax=Anopheles sinensis TaxID=74873 RepID=A0A084VML0_ANOSI|nr:AGAP001011-PA-like protein [Anopheles sinensis]
MLCVMFDWHKQLEIFFKKTEKEKKQAESKTPYEKKQKKVLTKLHKEDEKMQAQKIDLKTGATTILRFVSKLLEKGADFNIYMNVWALPFDLLWKYYETETDVAEFINYYCKPNVAMTTLSVEGKVKSNKRSVEFHKKTEDRDVCVTVELLEIFICFNDSKNFTNFWERFAVTSENVEKVITLLLHVAVERNYTTYVDLIMKKASREIFKIEGNKSKTLDVQENCAVTLEKTPTSAEKPPGCCCLKKNCSNKTNSLAKGTASNTQNEVLKMQDITPESKETRAATLERTSLSAEGSTSCWCCFKCCEKRHNPAVQEAHDPCAQKKKSRKHEDSRAKEEKLVHRFVLKGLLKKICLNGNLYLLKLFLDKVSDRFLLNEHPLLILTIQKMSKLKETQEFKYLHDCAKMLIENHCKIRMQDTDPNKNTALHLALSCGYDKLASLMLKEGHGLMGFRNRQNLTPIEYGTTEFWNTYLNNCITNKDGSELRFNVGFLKPLAKDESSNTSKSLSSKWYPRCIKLVEEMNETHNSKYRFTRTVNDMTALRLISQSTDRKEFLMHPVIIAFITMKWKRLCHWNVLNLLLTTITMFTFAGYTLLSPGTLKDGTMGFAIVGALILLVREIMQWWLLRWSYLTLENVVDIINLVFIGIVIVCGWEQGGVCEKVSIYSSFVVISLSLQASFLLGASWNNLSKTLYMFKTVSSSFFSSFLSFTPVLGAFIYSFYRTNNELLDDSSRYCFENNCSEENFNNFRSFWNATIKTLVMTTGEFEAANVNFESGKWLLFIGFLFIAPIVILNLINGLAVSDIAAIRQESEFISVCKKVRLLERYERAVVDSRSTMPEYLQRLFRDPWFPGSFFEKYESIIYVKVNEMNKLAIKTKKQEKSTKESSKNKASNENLVSNGTTCNVTPVCNDKEDMGTRQPESKIDRSTFNNNDTGNKKGDVSTPVDKNITPNNNDAMKRASRAGNDLQPIPGFPWLPSCSLRYYIGIRSFQLALYMSLDQSYVDMAKAIARSQLKNNSGHQQLDHLKPIHGMSKLKSCKDKYKI